MGSPNATYRSALIAYIQQSARYTKYERVFTDDYLYEQTTERLETIARRWNKNYPMYAAYEMGITLAYWMQNANIDEMNALPISELLDLVGIDDGDYVDYDEEN